MSITLGGKDFELKGKLNLNDFVDASDRGLDILSMKPKQVLSVKQMRTLLWIVLRKADNTLTEEWVGGNVDGDNMQEVMTQITNFITSVQSQPQDSGSDTSTTSEENTGGVQTT